MKIKILIFSILLFLIYSCNKTEKKNLAEIEKQEVATGIRHDSLLVGLNFGMTKEAFLDYCWGMNKKGLFREGEGKTVEYILGKREVKYRIQMNFYPTFSDNKITELPIRFKYMDMDIFNPLMKTDKLFKEVKKYIEDVFGGGFFMSPIPTGGKGYVKVEGNRRIMIINEKENEVMVILTDLTAIK